MNPTPRRKAARGQWLRVVENTVPRESLVIDGTEMAMISRTTEAISKENLPLLSLANRYAPITGRVVKSTTRSDGRSSFGIGSCGVLITAITKLVISLSPLSPQQYAVDPL
jgi:hypothetical protein